MWNPVTVLTLEAYKYKSSEDNFVNQSVASIC